MNGFLHNLDIYKVSSTSKRFCKRSIYIAAVYILRQYWSGKFALLLEAHIFTAITRMCSIASVSARRALSPVTKYTYTNLSPWHGGTAQVKPCNSTTNYFPFRLPLSRCFICPVFTPFPIQPVYLIRPLLLEGPDVVWHLPRSQGENPWHWFSLTISSPLQAEDSPCRLHTGPGSHGNKQWQLLKKEDQWRWELERWKVTEGKGQRTGLLRNGGDPLQITYEIRLALAIKVTMLRQCMR